MRGFPLLNLLIALLFSGAVLWPLVHQSTAGTGRSTAPAPAPQNDAAPAATTSARISIRLVHLAATVRLIDGNAVLHEWKPSPQELQLEESVRIPMNEQRTEFTVQINWPAGTPDTVAELRVEPDGLAARLTNLWSSGGSVDEVVSLTWKGDDR